MSVDEIEKAILKESGVLLYFYKKDCSVCNILKPKILHIFKNEFPKIENISIDSELEKEISAHFSIFWAPSILVFLDGKEFAREGRNIDIASFVKKIQRVYRILLE